MMTVRARMGLMLARWWLTGRQAPTTGVSRVPFRCVWTDCDINRHMNNSRYLALMDMGRWHYLLVSGMWRWVLDEKWAPVAVRIEIDYKKSIQPGDRVVLESEAVTASTRSVTVRQRFWRGEELCAEAHVVVLWLHKGQVQPIAPVFEALPHMRPASVVDGEVGQREAAHVGQ